MDEVLAGRASRLVKENADIWEAYQKLGKACSEAGPLEGRTLRLVKLVLAAGSDSEGAVHSQVRRGNAEGLSPGELRHVAFLAVTTPGFPKAVAALTWIEDIVEEGGETLAE